MSPTGSEPVDTGPERAPGELAVGRIVIVPGSQAEVVEQILRLPATWFNLEAVYHFLWGLASQGVYEKRAWAAAHSLLHRLRAREA